MYLFGFSLVKEPDVVAVCNILSQRIVCFVTGTTAHRQFLCIFPLECCCGSLGSIRDSSIYTTVFSGKNRSIRQTRKTNPKNIQHVFYAPKPELETNNNAFPGYDLPHSGLGHDGFSRLHDGWYEVLR